VLLLLLSVPTATFVTYVVDKAICLLFSPAFLAGDRWGKNGPTDRDRAGPRQQLTKWLGESQAEKGNKWRKANCYLAMLFHQKPGRPSD